MESLNCEQCGSPVNAKDKFCQSCGASLQQKEPPFNEPKTFVSKGTYSGKITKSKSSHGWKTIRNIIIVVALIGIIAIVIWFQTDPDAGEKLGNILFGFAVMAIFAAVIWRKSKKGQIQSPKQRKVNNDYDDNFETGVDSDDDYDD